MYFRGRLSIDPTQLTKIEKVTPSSGFKRLFHSITGGQVADKNEVETFKAINILQQLHRSFSANGIKNIIRLSHDDIDIYYDTTGEKNDLDFALDKYQIEIDQSMSTHFKTLTMVLEHEDEVFRYLIEITINKTHKENEYPIQMVISGMLKEFALHPGQTKEELKQRMQTLFKDQESYNMFITTKKLAFEQFLESIRFESMKHIRVDDIKIDIKTRMVIPKDHEKKAASKKEVQPEYRGTPYGYFGFGDLLLYAWLWSELSFDHNIHMSDVDLTTADGEFLSSVGAEGIDAADASIMDYSQDFDARLEDLDVAALDTDAMDAGGVEDMVDTETSTSWFDGVFEDMDFDLGDWL